MSDQPTVVLKSLLSQKLASHLLNNEYVRTGVTLFILGTAAQFATKAIKALWKRFSHLFIITLQVDSKDESYQWLIQWLSEHPYAKSTTSLMLTSTYDSEHGNNPYDPMPRLIFSPSLGSHFLRYKGNMYWLQRWRDSNATDMTSGGLFESITITLFGTKRGAIEGLVKDAMKQAFERDQGRIVLYNNYGGSWSRFGSRLPRPMESVILEASLKQHVIDDLKDFLSPARMKWYRELGIPYRRGYLFHGYPGSGKSSFILSLAGEFHTSVCIVNLNDKDMSDDQLNSLLNSAPPRSILLLEDIDAAFNDRSDTSDTRLTFSGLLNALDGVGAQEGRLVFMTTNKVSSLDAALVRPGRVDMICYFGLASRQQIQEMCKRFYCTSPELESMAVKLSELIPEEAVTMAQLQGFLLDHKTNIRAALANVPSWLQSIQNPRLQSNILPQLTL